MNRSRPAAVNYWPGFVDALTTLLLVLVFLLVVFVLGQVLLGQALTGKDETIERLNRQLDELSNLLSLERQANSSLRLDIAQLSASLQGAVAQRDELSLLLSATRARAEEAERRAGAAERVLNDLQQTQQVGQENLQARLEEVESLSRDIDALRRLRAELETEIAALTATVADARAQSRDLAGRLERSQTRAAEARDASTRLGEELEAARQANAALAARMERLEAELAQRSAAIARLEAARSGEEAARAAAEGNAEALRKRAGELETRLEAARTEQEAARRAAEAAAGALRDRTRELEARLADERERTLLAQKEIEAGAVRLAELQRQHEAQRQAAEEADKLGERRRVEIELLQRQIAALREELARLAAVLDAAEQRDRESQASIADLGRRLNRALAQKVEELARYRSEFFGRLREILGDRPGIQVVGDRFVLQSEVLFESGSAELGAGGGGEMEKLAGLLLQIAGEIPPELPWVLRVDGHTDRRPIATARFPSNWELSTARAVAVVRRLVELGVPAERLAAAGFGAFHPLDANEDETAFRRNRRIELKLTER